MSTLILTEPLYLERTRFLKAIPQKRLSEQYISHGYPFLIQIMGQPSKVPAFDMDVKGIVTGGDFLICHMRGFVLPYLVDYGFHLKGGIIFEEEWYVLLVNQMLAGFPYRYKILRKGLALLHTETGPVTCGWTRVPFTLFNEDQFLESVACHPIF